MTSNNPDTQSEPALVVPRRLAMQILHAAQVAQPEAIRGIVVTTDGVPSALQLDVNAAGDGDHTWARLWSHPQAPAVPQASELEASRLSLVVSLNTKGVLEMRAWQLRDGEAHERVLKIRD